MGFDSYRTFCLDLVLILFKQIEAEATAVRAVADTVCPLKIVLDRVVLTSTGVLLGCWQVSFKSQCSRALLSPAQLIAIG